MWAQKCEGGAGGDSKAASCLIIGGVCVFAAAGQWQQALSVSLVVLMV